MFYTLFVYFEMNGYIKNVIILLHKNHYIRKTTLRGVQFIQMSIM